MPDAFARCFDHLPRCRPAHLTPLPCVLNVLRRRGQRASQAAVDA